MMNKSKIEYCDFTWNPVTGCRHGCPYCYAKRQAHRFTGNAMINKGSEQLQRDAERGLWALEKPFMNPIGKVIPFPVDFEPLFREYALPMLAQKKKPATIFVVSMGDLFGEWVPDEWIEKVFAATAAAPWHRYLFLTKNPARYLDLGFNRKLPTESNYWFGSTVDTADKGLPFIGLMGKDKTHVHTFVSMEPLLEPFQIPDDWDYNHTEWIILGAETGNRNGKVKPQKEWIQNILDAAEVVGIPVFMKNNLAPYWDGELLQQYPW